MNKEKIKELSGDVMLSGIILITTTSIALSNLFVKVFIKPGELDVEKIERLYVMSVGDFYNNAHEFKGFILYLLLLCVFSVVFSAVFRKKYHALNNIKAIKISSSVLLTVSAFVFFYAFMNLADYNNGFYISTSAYYLDFKSTMIALICVLTFLLAVQFLKNNKTVLKFHLKNYIPIAANIFVFIAILYFASFYIINNIDVGKMFSHSYHFSAVFNPIFEVQNGNTLGIDLTALYGFYAYFFWAVETLLFGKVSIWGTTLIIGTLVAVSNISMYIILCKTVKSRLLAVLSLFSMIFFTQIFPLTYMNMTFYQYTPIRLVFPVLTMLTLTLLHTSSNLKRKEFYFILASTSAAIGLFWNPETGLICVLTVIAYCAYQAAEKYEINSLDFWKKFGRELIIILSLVVIATGVLNLFTLIRSGSPLSLNDMFWGIKAFAGDGFMMLPLPERHPYVIVLFIYSIAFIYPVTKLKLFRFGKKEGSETQVEKKNAQGNHALLFTLSVLGFGLFSYFLGRSHSYVFVLCLWPLFIIIPLICEKFIKVRNSKSSAFNVFTKSVSGGIAIFISTGLFFSGFSAFTIIKSPQMEKWNNQRLGYDIVVTAGVTDFILAYQKENMALIDEYSPFIMSHAGLKNEYKGSALIDCLFKQDYVDLLDFIENYQGRLFISRQISDKQVRLEQGSFNELLAEILAEKYVLLKTSHGINVYDRKKQR